MLNKSIKLLRDTAIKYNRDWHVSLNNLKNVFIYYEQINCPTINEYIVNHYEKLQSICNSHGDDFLYVPLLFQQLISEHIDSIKYYYPNLALSNLKEPTLFELNHNAIFSDSIVSNLDPFRSAFGSAKAWLVHYQPIEGNETNVTNDFEPWFDCFAINPDNPDSLIVILQKYYSSNKLYEIQRIDLGYYNKMLAVDEPIDYYSATSELGDWKLIHHNPDVPNINYADERFDTESIEILSNIRKEIEKLQLKGIKWDILKKYIYPEVKLSSLEITPDYRILLPDYNIEIEMAPLPKAVYLLFLSHPEGISFKCLSDYKEELAKFYSAVTNRVIEEPINKSIADICNPISNSINEKCARIREAFIKKITDNIAVNYYVTGKAGSPKRIQLPNNLITLNCKF